MISARAFWVWAWVNNLRHTHLNELRCARIIITEAFSAQNACMHGDGHLTGKVDQPHSEVSLLRLSSGANPDRNRQGYG